MEDGMQNPVGGKSAKNRMCELAKSIRMMEDLHWRQQSGNTRTQLHCFHCGLGKRERDEFSGDEDLKDNVKMQRQWPVRVQEIGMKESFQSQVSFQGHSTDSWIHMQQQKFEIPILVPTALNLQQQQFTAAALQDHRGIESSNHFYQPQLHQQTKYTQQEPTSFHTMQQIPLIETSAGSIHELLPSHHHPSPLQLPPPLIRTPPLYTETDVHGSPTSSSSSPFPSLQNDSGKLHAQPCTTPLQLLDMDVNDQSYSRLLCTTQPGLSQHQAGLPGGNSLMLKDNQVSSPWYPPMQDPAIYTEIQPVASTTILKRMDVPSMPGSQLGNSGLSSCHSDFGTHQGLIALPTQPNQVPEVYRDRPHEQDLQYHFNCYGPMALGGSRVGTLGISRGCVPSSPGLGKCHPQTKLNRGRQLLAGPYLASSSAGAELLLNPPILVNRILDDGVFLQQGMASLPKPVRSYTKVYKLGSITRALDVTRFSNYTDLRCELACMFGLEGQLDQKMGWQLVFLDNENDLLLVGDDPWDEFVISVRGIRILSPREVYFYMNEERFGVACNTLNAGAPKKL